METVNRSQNKGTTANGLQENLQVIACKVDADKPFKVTEDLKDEYAHGIIGDRPGDYQGIEVQGVRNQYPEGDPLGTAIEVDNDNPEFYSVYVHLKVGGSECVGDFGSPVLARDYAQRLHVQYGWLVYDFTKPAH